VILVVAGSSPVGRPTDLSCFFSVVQYLIQIYSAFFEVIHSARLIRYGSLREADRIP
jgi:hypothetical protein